MTNERPNRMLLKNKSAKLGKSYAAWKKWSLPVKLGVISSILGIISFAIYLKSPSPLTRREFNEYVDEIKQGLLDDEQFEKRIFVDFESEVPLDPIVKRRLVNLARDFENKEWRKLLSYFELDHLRAQLDFYLGPDFPFSEVRHAVNRKDLAVVRLYIKETLTFGTLRFANSQWRNEGRDFQFVEDLDEITSISYLQLRKKPELGKDYYEVIFKLHLKDGGKGFGRAWLNKKTLLITGASG